VQALRSGTDITVQLDADLYLAPHFLAWVAETFAREPRGPIANFRSSGQHALTTRATARSPVTWDAPELNGTLTEQ
jgi:hypothetical protein